MLSSRARRAGLTWPLDGLDDAALERRLYPPQATTNEQRPLPNWAVIQCVTLELLWQGYREGRAPRQVQVFPFLQPL